MVAAHRWSQDLQVSVPTATPGAAPTVRLPKLLTYSIDENDLLVSVGSGWDQFATANGGAECRSERVLERGLLSFVGGCEARHLYEILFERARRTREVVSLPFRCDGPAIRRFMKLVIHPGPERRLRFDSWILREEARPSIPLLEPTARRGEGWLRICSWCKLVRVGRIWMEVEAAVDSLRLFDKAELPKISHDCCASCAELVLES